MHRRPPGRYEVRHQGDWERWLTFFAEGIEVSATQALATANMLLTMVSRDRDRIATLGRARPCSRQRGATFSDPFAE